MVYSGLSVFTLNTIANIYFRNKPHDKNRQLFSSGTPQTSDSLLNFKNLYRPLPPNICSFSLLQSETSVRYYHYSLRNNPEERISQLLGGGSLKSRKDLHSIAENHMNGSWQRKPEEQNLLCSLWMHRNLENIPQTPGEFAVSRFESTAHLILRVKNPPFLRCKYCFTNARDFVNEKYTWNCNHCVLV